MRPAARRRWLLLHRGVGLLVGVVLIVIGATGALMAFEDEIVAILNRNVRRVPVRDAALLDPPQLLARLRDAEPNRRVVALELPRTHGAAVRVTWEDAQPESSGSRSLKRSARYVDPYTAASLADEGTRGEAFFAGARSLHRWLVLGDLGSRDLGRQAVGACTLALVLLALSGLGLRCRLPLRFGVDLGWRARGRARLFRPHVAIGTWALPVYFAVAATGLSWTYPAYLDTLHWLAGVERPARGERRGEEVSALEPSLDLAWLAAAKLLPAPPGLVRIRLPRGDGPVRVSHLAPQAPHSQAYDTLTLDLAGTVLEDRRYGEQSLAERLLSSRLALHTGAYFGGIGRALVCLGALSLPVVVGTGVWLYVLGYARRRGSSVRGERPTDLRPERESEGGLALETSPASVTAPLGTRVGTTLR